MAFYENGHKKTIYHFKHGKKYGLFQRFNEDEMLLKEGEYRDDYQNGIWKEFDYTDGALLFETSYKESVKNGIAKEYNKANRIAKEGHYKNNKKDGLWKHYNLAGKLVKEVVYNLGKKISTKEFN